MHSGIVHQDYSSTSIFINAISDNLAKLFIKLDKERLVNTAFDKLS